jgi:hypothetical protein
MPPNKAIFPQAWFSTGIVAFPVNLWFMVKTKQVIYEKRIILFGLFSNPLVAGFASFLVFDNTLLVKNEFISSFFNERFYNKSSYV